MKFILFILLISYVFSYIDNIPFCTKIKDNKCDQCEDGYKLENGACVINDFCTRHGATLEGTKCRYPPIYSKTGNYESGTCDNGKAYSGASYTNCNYCVEGNNNNKCIACDAGYYLDSNNACQKISTSNCLYDTTGENKCSKCYDKYSYDEDTGKCVVQTNNPKHCKQFINGVCVKYFGGFYFDDELNAEVEIKNCIENNDEDDQSKCTKCAEGFALIDGKCTSQYCDLKECKYFAKEYCEICNHNCTLEGDTCKSKYCEVFDDEGNCLRCVYGYYLQSGKCQKLIDFTPDSDGKCKDGYYLGIVKGEEKKECKKCEGLCTRCYDEFNCYANYSIDNGLDTLNQNRCTDAHCLKCQYGSTDVCLKCDSSSTLVNGICMFEAFQDIFSICTYDMETISSNTMIVGETKNLMCPPYEVNGIRQENYPYFIKKTSNGYECKGNYRDYQHNCMCSYTYYSPNSDKSSDCKRCTTVGCKRCSSEKCIECFEGATISTYQGVSTCVCPAGTYANYDTYSCEPCPSNCKECETDYDNPKQLKCTRCLDGREPDKDYSKINGQHCPCQEGYITREDVDGKVCVPKNPYCEEDYELKDEGSMYLRVVCKGCDDEYAHVSSDDTKCECNITYYNSNNNPDENGLKCEPCGKGCANCGIGADGYYCSRCVDTNADSTTNCTTCKADNCLDVATEETTPYNKMDVPVRDCTKCPDFCDGCTRDGSNPEKLNCKECKFDNADESNDCVCKENYYYDSKSDNCVSCDLFYGSADTPCGECKMDETDNKVYTCEKCKYEGFTVASQCTKCEKGYYYDPSDKRCHKCKDKCLECEKGLCTKCDGDLSPDTNGGCQDCSKSGTNYYYDNGCKQCSKQCLKCNDATSCTACQTYAGTGDFCDDCSIYATSENDHYYLNLNDGKCKKCTDPSCNNCTYNSETHTDQCEECDTTHGHLAEPVNGKCVCSKGYFGKKDENGIYTCVSCQDEYETRWCSECDETNCLECNNENMELVEGKCQCKSHFFDNHGDCTNCSLYLENCQECEFNGSSVLECTSCSEGYTWNTTTLQCYNNASITIIIALLIAITILI